MMAKMPDLRVRDDTEVRMVGPYALRKRLGQGGLGIVLEAWDPRLSRKVAIKLLRSDRRDDLDATQARARLLREARALARARHPNVIEIYDVGVDRSIDGDHGVFIVMELVAGVDGARWLAREDPAWPRILEVFCAAGRGLAAAHAVGILHRDFKPANILLGDDGRVRVLDFGLARAIAGSGSDDRSAPDVASTSDTIHDDQALTRRGLVMGTPRYMAPEQHFGQPMDVRTDVYNLCASIFWALYRVPPFSGETLQELAQAKRAERIAAPPAGRRVPARIHAAIVRGLRAAPSDRFSDMHELLAALQRGDRVPRRRRLQGGAVAGLSLLSVAVALAREPAHGCDDAPHWPTIDSAPVAAVHADLLAWRGAWARSYDDACARPVSRSRDAALVCLRRARQAYATTLELLADPQPSVLASAWRLVRDLPSPATCIDPAPDSVPLAADVDPLLADLHRARALAWTGRLSPALALVERTLARARTIDHVATRVAAEHAHGTVLDAAGEHAAAADAFERAYLLAVDAGLDAAAADAAIELVLLRGVHDPDPSLEAWTRRAEVELARLGPDRQRRARLVRHLAGAANTQGQPELARERLQEAERLLADGIDRDPLERAMSRVMLAQIETQLGDYDAASARLQAVIPDLVVLMGADHPYLVVPRSELGHVLRRQGDRDGALTQYEAARSILQATPEPDHPDVAMVENHLAIVLDELGRFGEAMPHYERALAVVELHKGAEHPWAASLHQNMAINRLSRGELRDAERHVRRALEIWELVLGAEHPEVAKSLRTLADVHAARGDVDAASDHYAEAIAILSAKLGTDHPELVSPLVHHALTLRRRDRIEDARVAAERALAIARERLGEDHVRTGRAYAVLGLIAADRGEKKRARDHRARAQALLTDQPGEEAWLGVALLLGARTTDVGAEVGALADAAIAHLREAGPLTAALVEEARALGR